MAWRECARGRRPRGAGEPRSWGRRVQAPRAPGGRLHDRSLWDPSPQSRQEVDSMTAACGTRAPRAARRWTPLLQPVGPEPSEPPGGRPRDRSLWDPSPQSLQEEDSMTAACVTRPDSDLNDQMINALLFSPSAWPAQNPPLRVQQQT